LPSGSCYGFSLIHEAGRNLFYSLMHREIDGLFRNELVGPPGYPTGTHRHDEAILALIMRSMGVSVMNNDPLFQSDSPECVIRSGGEMKL
jgi:hypothetical protein